MITADKIRDTLASHNPHLMPVDDKHRAAVAVVFHRHQNALRMLFIERTKREGDPWSGHIAFPGGRMEVQDDGPRHTAERETCEELGFTLKTEHYIGRLDDLAAHINPIKVSGFVYMIDHPAAFTLSEEVHEVFWVPVQDLADTTRHVKYTLEYEDNEHLVPAIDLLGPGRPFLWGLTYRFTTSLLALMGVDLPVHEPFRSREAK